MQSFTNKDKKKLENKFLKSINSCKKKKKNYIHKAKLTFVILI